MPEKVPEFVINALGLFDPEKYSPQMALNTILDVIPPLAIILAITFAATTLGAAGILAWGHKHTPFNMDR